MRCELCIKRCLKPPLAVLASRLLRTQIESTLAPAFARKNRGGNMIADSDLFGATIEIGGRGRSATGRPRLSIRLMASLLYRGVDKGNPGVEIIHRGKNKSLTKQQRRWLNPRQAVEPAIGHLKSENRMDRFGLQGSLGDALHRVLCAAGYNLRWLSRAMVRLGLTVL